MVIPLKKLCLYSFAFLLFCASAFAQITGTVTNRTNNRPAAGDDVVLLKLAQGMQELSRTKTDSKGRFTLQVPEDGLHLIRVTHDKANYFHPVQPGTQSVEIDVFTGAAAMDGITLTEDVMQVQTEKDDKSLKVVEHFLVKNESSPAKTLFSEHPFELNLPPGATVEGGAAKGPSGMAVQQPLVPLGNDRYTMIFPIRPGETEFHIFYHLPYNGSFTFHPKPTMDTVNLAVMLPKSMEFKPGPASQYTTVTDDVGVSAQAFVARDVKPSQPADFTVSGTGQLPRDAPKGTQAPTGPPGTSVSNADPNLQTGPGGGLANPVDKDAVRESWVSKYRWWLIAGLFLLMCAGAALMLSRPPVNPLAPAGPRPLPPGGGDSLQTLRDEMFTLETDRLEGRISEEDYAQHKAAFDLILRRALARTVRVVPE